MQPDGLDGIIISVQQYVAKRKVVVVKGVQDVKRPACSLLDVESNVYALIGRVSQTLEDADLLDRVDEFVYQVLLANNYDEVLRLSQAFVDFE